MSTSELNNKMIANYLGVGERTLRDRVKKILGVTIKEYLHRLRLENAKLLIQKGQFSLSEIAHATGFSSLSYFSTAYKKYFGFPPSADN